MQETSEIVEMQSTLSLNEMVQTIASLPDMAASTAASAAAPCLRINA